MFDARMGRLLSRKSGDRYFPSWIHHWFWWRALAGFVVGSPRIISPHPSRLPLVSVSVPVFRKDQIPEELRALGSFGPVWWLCFWWWQQTLQLPSRSQSPAREK